MMARLQILIAVLTLCAIIYIGNKVRKRVIELKYALVWFLVAFLLLIVDAFPQTIEKMSDFLGIVLPINMLMLFGFGFVLLILYTFTIVITNQDRRIKRLIQEVSILDYRIDELEKALKKEDIKVKKIKTKTADEGPEHKVKVKNKSENKKTMEEQS
ncbi:MAG: DUF2304 domain-containing protein [Lachnospiraceae bacterium]|nr:DUF2304 domain-containing protein [Lachnospiraceae bacterium]